MQEKGKKKVIDNAGALQKKYAWKSEKTQDTKKAPQDTKKPAAVCPYAKNVAAVIIRECPMNNSCRKTDLCAQKHWGLL